MYVILVIIGPSSLAVSETCVSSHFQYIQNIQGETLNKCSDYNNKQRQNIPDANNKELNLPFGSETLSEEGTLNFRPRKREQRIENQNVPFNKEQDNENNELYSKDNEKQFENQTVTGSY